MDVERSSLLDKVTIMRNIPKFIVYIVLVPLFFIFALTIPGFLSTYNLVNLLQHIVFIGIIAIGSTFIVITGGLDISLGTLASLSSVCAAKFLLVDTLPTPVVFMLVMFIGMSAGLLNAFLIYKLRLTIAVTFATQILFFGMALLISQGDIMEIDRKAWIIIGQGKFYFLPLPVVILVLLLISLFFLERFSVLGKKIYYVGGNEEGALLSGINIWQVRCFSFMLGGAGAALAGIVTGAQLHFGSSLLGQGAAFESVVAIFLGGAIMAGGKGSVMGTLGGVLLIGMVSNVLMILDVPPALHSVVNGFVLLGALAMNYFLFLSKR